MKKLSLILLILVLFAFLCVGLIGCVDKGNEYLTKADVNVYIEENGDIKVVERWDGYIGSESRRNLYREINVYDPEFGAYSSIENFSVVNNLSGEALTFYPNVKDPASYDNNHLINNSYVYKKNSKNYEVGFYMPETNYEDFSYTMTYTLTDMVRVYGDCAVLYYRPFSEDFSMYIDEINLNVHFPSGATVSDDTLFWLHTKVDVSGSEIVDNHLNFYSSAVEAGNYTEIRVLFPKDTITGAQKVSNEKVRQAIIDEEFKWQQEWIETQKKAQNTVLFSTILGVLLVVVSILLVVYFKVFYPKVKGDYPPYVREIPAGFSSGEMAHYYYHYKGTLKKQKHRGNVLSALVMDFARRGYLNLLPDTQNKGDYLIEIVNVPPTKESDLDYAEKEIYSLLKSVSESVGGAFNMSQFEKYAKKNPVVTNNRIHEFFKLTGKNYMARENYKNPTFKGQTIFGIGLIACVLGAMVFAVGQNIAFFGAGALIAGIILMIGYPRGTKFSKKGEEKYMKAKGLEAFLLDFSNLKEHEIPALILWEEYMVYATMMGISDRVLEELKLKYPELSDRTELGSDYYRRNSYLYFYVHMNLYYGPTNFGTRMNLSFTNVAKTSHTLVQSLKASKTASSISSGFGRGGGGFGGGGGGFGGGGGGAR